MNELPVVVDHLYGDIALEPYLILLHPDTLVVGEHYIHLNRCGAEAGLVFLDVQFVAYTACPALVVVLDGSGQKARVLRDELYAYPLSSRHGSTHDDSSTK